MSDKIMKIGTHNGAFHCDEVLACFLLKLLPQYENAVIIRSRDKSVLQTCDIVVDVGDEYNPSIHRYDHHMRSFNESLSTVMKKPGFDSTIKLSSAGLIYCHFGFDIIRKLVPRITNENVVQCIFKKVYKSFVREIDAIDNGVSMFDGEPLYRIETGISSRVKQLNPSWNEKTMDVEKQFSKAMDLVGQEFVNTVEAIANTWLPARVIVEEALAKRFEVHPSGEVIEFSQCAPWREHLFNLEEEQKIKPLIKFVIFKDDTYRIQAVPITIESFALRLPLPEHWAGLRGEELCKATLIDGSHFVHNNRFIGGNLTREGILEMANKALEMAPPISE